MQFCMMLYRAAMPPVVGRFFQPRRIIRRQNGVIVSEMQRNFANNARSLRFAVVIRGVILLLSSTRLDVYCICHRCCIVRRYDNAIRDAKATSRYVICVLFALHLAIVNENQTFTMRYRVCFK